MVDGLAYDDLDLYGRELDDPLAELEQDTVHTLLEGFGTNPDAPTRGLGLDEALSGQADESLMHRIETGLEEDDRIVAAQVTFTPLANDGVHIDLEVQPNAGILKIAVDVDGNGNVTRSTP